MAKFSDKKGHEWQLTLDVGLVQEVKDETGVNLSIVAKDLSWIDALFEDGGRLVSVLHVLLSEQIQALNLSPKDFAKRFDGPTLEKAGEALLHAVCDFFPRSRIAQALRANISKAMATAEDKVIAKMGETALTALNSATSSPESSALTPEG